MGPRLVEVCAGIRHAPFATVDTGADFGEALLQLESEGLVVIHTHKGAIVASLSPEDASIYSRRV